MNNYVKSLASHIFKKMNEYQTDEQVRKEKPMLWPAGIYFTENNIKEWIEEHDRQIYCYTFVWYSFVSFYITDY